MSATFHSLRVAAIDELTDDSVALTFDGARRRWREFQFAPGQHLSIRGGDDVRRTYSLCAVAVLGRAADRREAAARRRVREGVVSRPGRSATSST